MMTLFIFTADAGWVLISMTIGNKGNQKCELTLTPIIPL